MAKPPKKAPVKKVEEEVAEPIAEEAAAEEVVEPIAEEPTPEEAAEAAETMELEELIPAAQDMTEQLGLEPALYEDGMDAATLTERMVAASSLLEYKDVAIMDDATKRVLGQIGIKLPENPKAKTKTTSKEKTKAEAKPKLPKAPKEPKPPKVSYTRLEAAVEAYVQGGEQDLVARADALYQEKKGVPANEKEAAGDVRRFLNFLEAAQKHQLKI